MPLTATDFLEDGQTYTFSVNVPTISPLSVDEVTSKVSGITGVGGVTVLKTDAGLFSPPRYDITFQFSELISYTVQDMADAITASLSSWFHSAAFVSASLGTVNTSNQGTKPSTDSPNLPSILPSTTWIIAAVVGLGIVAFLASGGASAVRRATGN
jgi:hypothetical protein